MKFTTILLAACLLVALTTVSAGDASSKLKSLSERASASDSLIEAFAQGLNCNRPVAARPATISIPANIVALARSRTKPAGTARRAACPAGAQMTEADIRTITKAVWTAFGATPAQAQAYTDANVRQMRRESSLCPAIVQGIIKGDPNNNNPAGGLFQFIPQTYNTWAVKGYEINRYNPLSNILAAVNAQINSHCVGTNCAARVLNGCSGWSPQGGSNPYRP